MYIGQVMEEAPTEELFATLSIPTRRRSSPRSRPSIPQKRRGLSPDFRRATLPGRPAPGLQVCLQVSEGDAAVQGKGDRLREGRRQAPRTLRALLLVSCHTRSVG